VVFRSPEAARGLSVEAAAADHDLAADVVALRDAEQVHRIDKDVAEQTAADITASGGTATVCAGNVTDADFADRYVDTAARAGSSVPIAAGSIAPIRRPPSRTG
jgi:hypothetical protein